MNPAADLSWLAFQYVAGELDAEAAAAFELRLADDQEAREAVAGAVGLAQVVRAAASPSARSGAVGVRAHRSLPFPVRRWTAVAAAACLSALAVGAWRFAQFAPAPSPSSPDATATSPAVALTWTGLAEPDELLAWLDEPSLPAEVEVEEGPEGDDAGPPAWLIEAAFLRESPEPGLPDS